MPATSDEIAAVAQIAYLHGSRSARSAHPWRGRSLRDLLDLCGYPRLRPRLTEEELRRWLAPRWRVQREWLLWCDDKRTPAGFYVKRLRGSRARWVIGSFGSTETTEYRTQSAALAAYILRELDYWASPRDARR